MEWAQNESGPSINLHQPFTLTQPLLLLPLVSRTSSPIYLSHHVHRHSNFSAWRSSHRRLHSHQISAASHHLAPAHAMPCQTELQACPPNNFKHPTREDPVVNRSSPHHANARNIQRLQERKRHSHVSTYVSPCAVINSDEHTLLNTTIY
jgi:hypothetical protein